VKRPASAFASYRIAFRKKIYGSIAHLQADLDRWVQSYNEERPHSGTMVLWQDADANLS